MDHKTLKNQEGEKCAHLLHEATLAITVRVDLGVQLVHEARLLVLAGHRVMGVGVVCISPGAILCQCLGHAVLGGVCAVVTSEVVVLLAGVTSGTSSGTCYSTGGATLVVGGAVRVCTSEAGTGSAVQLTLVKASSIVAVTGSVVVVTVAGSASNVVVVTVTLTLANSTETASGTSANVLGDTLEGIVTLLAASKSSTLVLELVHGHGWESCGAVVGSLVVVNLMNGDGGVNNIGLNGLLLHDRLDSLVNVVVDVLTTDGGGSALAVCGGVYATLVLEASLLVNEVPLSGVVITVVELAMLNGTKLGGVLLGKNLAVLNRLDSAVVVVLVNLLVNSGLNLLVEVGLDDLVLDSRCNSLVDSGIVVSRLGHEVSDSCLGLVHCDVLICDLRKCSGGSSEEVI